MSDEIFIDKPPVAVVEPVVRPGAAKRARPERNEKPKKQPRYVVIVHIDDYHTFPYVAELLQKVCGHAKPRAWLLTRQVHFAGRAPVWTGSLEVAELKPDQIRGYGPDHYAPKPVTFPLGVTIEPLDEE